MLVLLSCAALMTLVAPLWGVAILSLALAVMGLVVLCDFAVRGHSRIDPRLATLLLVAGVGNLQVEIVRLREKLGDGGMTRRALEARNLLVVAVRLLWG